MTSESTVGNSPTVTDGADTKVSPAAAAIALAASVLAVVFGIVAAASSSDVFEIGAASTVAVVTAIVAGVAGIVAGVISIRRGHTLGSVVFAALAVVTMGVVIGCCAAIGSDPDLYRFFDSHGAVVYALAGSLLGGIGIVSALMIPSKARPRSRSVGVLCGVLVVALGVGVTVPLARGYAQTPWEPHVGETVDERPFPTSLGEPAYSVAMSRHGSLLAVGSVLVDSSGSRFSAVDGASGDLRWSLDLGDFSPESEADQHLDAAYTWADGRYIVRIVRGDAAMYLDLDTGDLIARGRSSGTSPFGDFSDDPESDGMVVNAADHSGRVTVTGADGDVVDSFELPRDFRVGRVSPGGTIILQPSQLPSDDTFRYRDVELHETRTLGIGELALNISEGDSLDAQKVTSLGDRLVIGDARSLVTVDAAGRVADRRVAPCAPDSFVGGVDAVRGAVVIECVAHQDGARTYVGMR